MIKEATEHLEGVVREIIFQNDDTGYRVLELEDADGNLVTAVGTLPGVNEGEILTARGYWDEHTVYGEQFRVCSFSRTLPKGREAMQRYLASGAVKGVGNALAARIVAHFGDDTFAVIERHPERLAEVKGIGPAAACLIGESFAKGREARETMMFLQEYGITNAKAYEIFKRFEGQTVSLIKKNPYILTEVEGIGFKTADEIARRMGVSEDSPERVKACVLHVLRESANKEGNCYLPYSETENKVYEAIDMEGTAVENAVTELGVSGKVRIVSGEDPEIFLKKYYRAERMSAGLLTTLARTRTKSSVTDADIARVEKQQKVVLSEQQKKAIRMALTEGVSVITGGPGTGKTTILNTLLPLLTKQKETYLLAAPTGRAAKRMSELTGEPACTLHRLLEVKPSANFSDSAEDHFARNEDNPLEGDVVIIDEVSMVDAGLFFGLLRALAPGMRLILVGDSDQLPSVGPGNVLGDILASEAVPVTRLTEIYRQAEASDIVLNAHRVNNGEYPVYNGKGTDFFIVHEDGLVRAQKTVVELVKTRIPKFAHVSAREIQVMSPQHKGELGIDVLNKVLQKELNPPAKSKRELEFRDTVFREGDRVMQLKNNYDVIWEAKNEYGIVKETGNGVFNGDTGLITRISMADKSVTVLFDEYKEVEYSYQNLEELTLCYAVTVHKSQGSQSPVVILPMLGCPAPLCRRNLLYTAITRAERYVIIVGSEENVRRMVDNNTSNTRYTALARFLKELKE